MHAEQQEQWQTFACGHRWTCKSHYTVHLKHLCMIHLSEEVMSSCVDRRQIQSRLLSTRLLSQPGVYTSLLFLFLYKKEVEIADWLINWLIASVLIKADSTTMLFWYLKIPSWDSDMSDHVVSYEIVSECKKPIQNGGILFQRLPEGKPHQTKHKSHWSLRWQIETLNNCITAIIFGNGKN